MIESISQVIALGCAVYCIIIAVDTFYDRDH